MNAAALLDIQGLQTHFHTARGVARAVDDLDLALGAGETLAVVGESGCGKTMLALSVLRLVPQPPGKIVAGRMLFRGQDLLALSEAQMRGVRGNQISMIFQEPMTALNPVFTVGEQIAEVFRTHRRAGKAEAREAAREMLDMVGFPNPVRSLESYPHQLSGGMRQRVVIAMALACNPALILADEPTTALDVTIQAQILRLMLALQERNNASILLITHDLGIVAQTCQRVQVMYAGRIVESADVQTLFAEPMHPYTQGLLRSLPRGERKPGTPRVRLTPIPGTVPGLYELPRGCAFHPRCPHAFERCREEAPAPIPCGTGHSARCWLLSR